MNKALAIAACLHVAFGDLAGPINSLIVELGTVDSRLKGWAASDGLNGALRIQEAMRPVSGAVSALHSSVLAESTFNDETAHQAIQQFDNITPALQTLLADLSSKAGDFRDIGAAPIVARDLRELDPVVASVVAAVYSKIPNGIGCDVVSGASAIGGAISAALVNAGSHYSEQVGTAFPSLNVQCANYGRQGTHHADDDLTGNILIPAQNNGNRTIANAASQIVASANSRNATTSGLPITKPNASQYAVAENTTHIFPFKNDTGYASTDSRYEFQNALANGGSTLAASMAMLGVMVVPVLF